MKQFGNIAGVGLKPLLHVRTRRQFARKEQPQLRPLETSNMLLKVNFHIKFFGAHFHSFTGIAFGALR